MMMVAENTKCVEWNNACVNKGRMEFTIESSEQHKQQVEKPITNWNDRVTANYRYRGNKFVIIVCRALFYFILDRRRDT